MACSPEMLKRVPLFALLDDEETAVLAGQVEVKTFAPRQRIWKIGDPGGQAYVMVSGTVRVTTVDEDQQEVIVDEPAHGEFFGFASMLEQTPHQTSAIALEESDCLEVDRDDIAILLQRKPHGRHGPADRAGPAISRLAAPGPGSRQPQSQRHYRAGMTFGERIADSSPLWRFVDLYHYLCACHLRLHRHQCHPRAARRGIHIPSSC